MVLIKTHKETLRAEMFATEVWISHFNVTLLPASALCFGRPHAVNTSNNNNDNNNSNYNMMMIIIIIIGKNAT